MKLIENSVAEVLSELSYFNGDIIHPDMYGIFNLNYYSINSDNEYVRGFFIYNNSHFYFDLDITADGEIYFELSNKNNSRLSNILLFKLCRVVYNHEAIENQ